ncbi:MAG: type II toxin-antitoxin system VapC family toxin [Woeseia sp.]
MIVLDTNVLSELMKAEPDTSVVGWVTSQPASRLFITAITQGEILYGIGLLPNGRRRNRIAIAAKAMFAEDFNDRILAFNSDAAAAYADIAVARRASGRPISQFDAQIAAIARSGGAAVATRNVDDFEDCGIDLINPW